MTEIYGSLSTLTRGLPKDENIMRSLVGKLPIKNSQDQIIGHITRVDIENDRWYGLITEDGNGV